jgi:hypothetical protein
VKTWETNVVMIDWDAASADYRAAIGHHDEPVFGLDRILNTPGSHGWELVSFAPLAWQTSAVTTHIERVTSYIAVYKRIVPD